MKGTVDSLLAISRLKKIRLTIKEGIDFQGGSSMAGFG